MNVLPTEGVNSFRSEFSTWHFGVIFRNCHHMPNFFTPNSAVFEQLRFGECRTDLALEDELYRVSYATDSNVSSATVITALFRPALPIAGTAGPNAAFAP